MKNRWNRAILCLMPVAMLMLGTFDIIAQSFPPGFSTPQVESPLTQLSWENDHQHASPKPTDLTADFTFAFTNISDSEIVIDHVKTSCSCTAAKLPSQPWHLPAHTNGQINVSVNLKGKDGEFEKTITVFFGNSNTAPKALEVKVSMPNRMKMRNDNMQLAQADRQAVFKGECAKCHAEPAKTLTGMALYHEICGVCHEAHPRASMVPDLRLIRDKPTDFTFWKTNIAYGKPGTLMPAFATSQGGPLTDEQIDMLAKAIDSAYPYARFAPHPIEPIHAGPQAQIINIAPTAQKN
jgi:mono/diheme cytochrome c family protein